jgi:hypothetical protein
MWLTWAAIKLAAAPALGVLRAVPWQAWAAAGAIGAAWSWHSGRVEAAHQAGKASVQALWAAANVKAAQAAASAAAEHRATEQRREAAARKGIDDATLAVDRARADADRAGRAAAGLRDAARAAAARCGGAARHPTPAASGAPAASAGDLLADVLGLVEQAGRDMAAEADRRGIAGAACERLYDSLAR